MILGYGKIFFIANHSSLLEHAYRFLSIWTTSWIPTLPNFKPTSKFPSNKEQLSLFISTILSLFDDLSTQEILNIYISHSLSPKYIWTPATSGKFSISSAYLSILAINHPELIVTSSQPFWKHL
jgi:hypothetical protein